MAKKHVSSKKHGQKQLDDYANQHNPNNKAYRARMANAQPSKKALKHKAIHSRQGFVRRKRISRLFSPLWGMQELKPP